MLKQVDFSACFNRGHFQSKRMSEYEKIVLPIVNKIENTDILQFVLESLIIRYASSFEELLKCLIQIATPREESKIRDYFKKNGSTEIKGQITRGCKISVLIAFAEAEASFKDDAKKLERIFNCLFGFSPFPDRSTKDYVLDMILIRNIIIHEGGWPKEGHANQIKHPGAIKISKVIDLGGGKKSVFYKLELTDYRLLNYIVYSLAQSTFHIAKKLSGINGN